MTQRRDRLVAGAAVLAVLLLAALIVSAVLDAQRNGRQALERLQLEQVDQLAASTNTRFRTTLQTPIARSRTWELTVGSAADRTALEQLHQVANLRNTGLFLVDAAGRITQGYLLERDVIGAPYPEPAALERARGGGSIGSVHRGLTTSAAVVDIVLAVPGPSGPRGYLVIESEVGPDSNFNQEVRNLRRGRTGAFSFVDANKVVVASSDPGMIATRFRLGPALRSLTPGFHRGGGEVAAVGPLPDYGWSVVFRQDAGEFEGGLTRPVRSALLLVALVTVVLGGAVFVGLLRRLRAARLEQRRLATVNQAQDEFIGIVSHELRTPVSGLVGFLQTTLDHWDAMPDDDRRRAVGRGFANARRLQSLTADVLDTARIDAGDFPYSFERLDLQEEVASAAAAAQDGHPTHVVSFTRRGEPVWVEGDGDRLQQVLTNLLDNALKHSPLDAPVDVEVHTADGEVTVSVTDRGPGIAPEEADRIFDKFVRGRDDTVGGTGLGLYICRRIVDAHGGRIRAANAPGRGAVIAFTLPLAPAAPAASGDGSGATGN